MAAATNKFKSAKENSWPFLKIFIIILSLSSLPFLVASYFFIAHRMFWANARITQGTITSESRSTACSYNRRRESYSDCEEFVQPVFSYVVEGRTFIATSQSQINLQVGEKADVAYSPTDPKIAELVEGISWMPFLSLILYFLSLIGFVIASIYFWLYLKIWLRYRSYLIEKRAADRMTNHRY